MKKQPVVVDISYRYDKKSNNHISLLQLQAATSGHFSFLAERTSLHVVRIVDRETHFKQEEVNYHFVEGKETKAWLPFRLNQFIHSLKPDIVLVHGFFNPLQVLLLKFQTRATIVIQYQGGGAPFGITGFVQKLVSLFVTDYIFTAAGQANEFIKKRLVAATAHIHEITEGSTTKQKLDKLQARQFLKIDPESLIVLWVGGLHKRKDPLTVLKGLENFLKENPHAKILMIYHEFALLEEVKKFISASEALYNGVTLIGKLPNKDLDYYYSSADYFVLGSHSEGSGIALLEAMSCGCVPLVTDIPSFRIMTDNGRLGALWTVGDAESLKNAIKTIQKKDIEKESLEVIDHFQKEHSFQAIAKKLYGMTCKIMARKN